MSSGQPPARSAPRPFASSSQSVSIATALAALAGIGWFISVALSFVVKGRDGNIAARLLLEHPIPLAVNGLLAVGFLGAAWLLNEERRSGALLLLGLSVARIILAVAMGSPSMINLIVGLVLPVAAYAAYRELSRAQASRG